MRRRGLNRAFAVRCICYLLWPFALLLSANRALAEMTYMRRAAGVELPCPVPCALCSVLCALCSGRGAQVRCTILLYLQQHLYLLYCPIN